MQTCRSRVGVERASATLKSAVTHLAELVHLSNLNATSTTSRHLPRPFIDDTRALFLLKLQKAKSPPAPSLTVAHGAAIQPVSSGRLALVARATAHVLCIAALARRCFTLSSFVALLFVLNLNDGDFFLSPPLAFTDPVP